jgi:uncharacterized membrane protein YeiH
MLLTIMQLYYLQMLGTALFAITGVLAVNRLGLDVFGGLVLGVVTALGGGTLRDMIMGAPVFWLEDFNYVWTAVAAALVAFFLGRFFRRTSLLLLHLDGVGAALFGVVAVDKVLDLQFSAPVAVIMGVMTSIGGGVARDVLAKRTTLLMSREIYATPILLGCTLYVLLRHVTPDFVFSRVLALTCIAGLRAIAIHWHLAMPPWLTSRDGSSGPS